MHRDEFGDINSLHKVKQYLVMNKKLFWPNNLDVYMRQFPPQGGAWHHQWMMKVTSCGIKCTANKLEPGSAHDHRYIMTSPGYTGISCWDMQTSAPRVAISNIQQPQRNHVFRPCIYTNLGPWLLSKIHVKIDVSQQIRCQVWKSFFN